MRPLVRFAVRQAVCQMSKHPKTLEDRVSEKSMIIAGVCLYEGQRA